MTSIDILILTISNAQEIFLNVIWILSYLSILDILFI